jgi:hypothetical protein
MLPAASIDRALLRRTLVLKESIELWFINGKFKTFEEVLMLRAPPMRCGRKIRK